MNVFSSRTVADCAVGMGSSRDRFPPRHARMARIAPMIAAAAGVHNALLDEGDGLCSVGCRTNLAVHLKSPSERPANIERTFLDELDREGRFLEAIWS